MKVFLTGGSGFLGSHCAKAIKDAGHEVFALVRPSSKRDLLGKLGVRFVEGDVETPDSYRSALAKSDAVLHVAGVIKAKKTQTFDRINARATRTLAETALQENPGLKRFVFVSSIAAVGPSPKPEPRPADLVENPVTAYGRSKLHAEKLLLELSDRLPLAILRPTIIYGERDYEFLKLLKVARQIGFLPTPNPRQILTYVYAQDVAGALVKALDAKLPLPFTCHVEDGHTYTFKQTARIFTQQLGIKIRPLHIPKALFWTYCAGADLVAGITGKPPIMGLDKAHDALQAYWIGGTKALTEVLGYQPQTEFSKGLERQITWARQEGLL